MFQKDDHEIMLSVFHLISSNFQYKNNKYFKVVFHIFQMVVIPVTLNIY